MKTTTSRGFSESSNQKKMKENRLKTKALNLSIREGVSHSVMIGAGNSFITPFALALRATNFQIGFLASFAGFVGPLAQLGSIHLMEKFSRKKIVIVSVFLQAIMWLPIAALVYLFSKGILLNYLPLLLILFYSLLIGIGAISEPAWFSWMGDLVSEKERGRYFGKRMRITKFVAMIAMLIAGFLLDFFKTGGLVLAGFSILFLVSAFSRLTSSYLFSKQYAPKMKLRKGYYFSFFDFIKHSYKTNFGRFVFFVGLMYFASFIASPFIAVYLLKDLGFSYLLFTFIVLVEAFFSIMAFKFWGVFGDRYGNKVIMIICSVFIPLVPVLMIFSPSPIYLIFVPFLISGIFWAGFDLSAFNFVYDSVNPEHRALCATYRNVVIGLGIFFGSIIGGILTKYLSVEFISRFGFSSILLFIFLISGIARALVALVFLPGIKEVRKTKKMPRFSRYVGHIGSIEHGLHSLSNPIMHQFDVTYVPSQSVQKAGRIFVKGEE